jgi:hypothetical protein
VQDIYSISIVVYLDECKESDNTPLNQSLLSAIFLGFTVYYYHHHHHHHHHNHHHHHRYSNVVS